MGELDYEFRPSFTEKEPQQGIDPNFIRDTSEPIVVTHQGMRKGGKGVSTFGKAVILKESGMLIQHLWSARSNENLYWMINKNCKQKYKNLYLFMIAFLPDIEGHVDNLKNEGFNDSEIRKIKLAFLEKTPQNISLKEWVKLNGLSDEEYDYYLKVLVKTKMITDAREGFKIRSKGIKFLNGKLLHCKCNNSHNVLWVVPNYVKFDEESVDRWNGVFWKDLKEYSQYFSEITKDDKSLLVQGKLKKPQHLRPIPKLKIAYITPPTTASRAEIFRLEYLEIMLQGRQEHRVIVQNPSMFEGKLDKFVTLAEQLNMQMWVMNKSGYFRPKNLDEIKTKWDELYHTSCVVINELKSVAPSNKLSPEAKSGVSKKAIVDLIPEARHYKLWFLGDYQNPEDLYAGVRPQVNYSIIKRASKGLLGKDWEWLFEKIEYDREMLAKYNFPHLSISHPRVQKFLEKKRPRVSQLPDNLEYVTNINNEIMLQESPLPDFHLKTSLEDFSKDTGIRWWVDSEKAPKDKGDEQKVVKVNKKDLKKKLANWVDAKKNVEKLEWDKIYDDFLKEEEFKELGLKLDDKESLGKWFRRNQKLCNLKK